MSKISTNRTTDFDEGFDVEPIDIAIDESGDRLSLGRQLSYDDEVAGLESSGSISGDYDDDTDWMERYDNTGYAGWSRLARQS